MNPQTFNCPHCQQSLEAPDEMCGETTNCPSCDRIIQIPDHQPRNCEESLFQSEPHDIPSVKETKTCPYCGEPILISAIKCKHCGEFLAQRQGNRRLEPQKRDLALGKPTCQQCGGKMNKTVVSSGNCSGIVLALIAFCVGIIIAFAIPVIGWVIGPLICIGALFMGGKRNKVWKCAQCSSVINRA
jgi:hypothetical protein